MNSDSTSENMPFRQRGFVSQVATKLVFLSMGVLLSLVMLEAGLRVLAFGHTFSRQSRNFLSLKANGEYRILALGESTTAVGGDDSYPGQLERILNSSNLGQKFTVINEGVVGTNSFTILSNLEKNLMKYKPDMVIVMMGVNDERYASAEYGQVAGATQASFPENLKVYRLLRIVARKLIVRFRLDQLATAAATELGRQDYDSLIHLAWNYQDNGQRLEAEKLFKKAIEIKPEEDAAYLGLGWVYDTLDRPEEAEVMFKKAVEKDPDNAVNHSDFANFYSYHYDYFDQAYEKELAMREKALTLDPKNYRILTEAGLFYVRSGELDEAEALYQRAITLADSNDKGEAYLQLGELYRQQGKTIQAAEMFKRADERNSGFKKNYRQLERILKENGTKLVAVQYPLRSLQRLKDILGESDEVIFVDNEVAFKQALSAGRYEEYFLDKFAGDFGHATAQGNRLIADDIFKAILAQCPKCLQKL